MPHPIHVVDAFTDTAFKGNPAGVCFLDGPAENAWMQSVAAELNLSETAFVTTGGQGGGYALRWFTPTVEVELCGHATLAAAHVLWETGRLDRAETARFQTASGELAATFEDGWISLDFPVEPPVECEVPVALADGLDTVPLWCGQNRMDYLVEVDGEGVLRGIAPDFSRLMALKTRGMIVTALSDTPGIDFVSRFFAPRSGIDEDPVTGSAHCALACYWSKKLGKDDMIAYQVSRRGGWLRVRKSGARCVIAGQAVTVWRGEILV